MFDNIKIITYDQATINRLSKMKGFEPYQHRNNNYFGLCKYRKLMRLDFRKCFEKGQFVGYHHVAISISPHYHFNNYLHNGNDLPPKDCIKTIFDILHHLEIEPQYFNLLKVVNIEFGVNIIPKTDIKNIINNLLFYRKTKFVIPNNKTPYFKITNATKYKLIKIYAKGLQFAEFPEYAINVETLRFEVKSKKSIYIKKLGIYDLNDLLKIETYQKLEQEIDTEWQNVLIINPTPDYNTLKTDEVEFVKSANRVEFWDDLKEQPRNKFNRYKEKYYKILKDKNNLHTQIKGLIIDKILSWLSGAYLPQKTPIKKENTKKNDNPKEINGQSAPPHQNIKLCKVTKLPIPMQKILSETICIQGLKYYKEKEPNTYKSLQKKYLRTNDKDLETQFWNIAHNIRNEFWNKKHNRLAFEKRNYHPNQLQLF